MPLALVVIGILYALSGVVVARRKALEELDNLHYPPYDLYDYAQAGIWGFLLGALWPLLAIIVVTGAGIGWLVTRGQTR